MTATRLDFSAKLRRAVGPPDDPDIPDGRLLGRLEVPRKIRGSNVWVAGFGVNELLMREFDSDGFEHLVFYPIVPIRR